MLSLLQGGEEREYEHGFFAHAYSVLAFDGLETLGFVSFETTMGINKTARVNNTQASVQFRILLDGVTAYASDALYADSDAEQVTVDVTGADTLVLVADSLGGNGNDHAVWADCKLTYYDAVKPSLRADDIEFANPWCVTPDSILQNAKASAFDGTDLSGSVTYTTDYEEGKTGAFSVTYRVSDGVSFAEKTVEMKVLSSERYVTDASIDVLTAPFANSVYYGRSQLRFEARKGYDLLLEKLLQADISDASRTTVTVEMQANDIWLFPSEVETIKRFLFYDEARLYYIYYWAAGDGAGVTYTTEGGFVDTVTVKLYNGTNEYYFGQNNRDVYLEAEKSVTSFFSKLSPDMSEAQMLASVQNSYISTLSYDYSSSKYADGMYGVFIKKKVICSGYSRGYAYLAQRLGIQAAYTFGIAGGAHAWNHVRAEGQWYMTDTTWGNAANYGMLGQDYMTANNRYDYSNYGNMPTLAPTRYDTALTAYPLFGIEPFKAVMAGSDFGIEDLVTVSAAVQDKAPIVSVTYTGDFDIGCPGDYTVEVTARNSLGNVATQTAEILVLSSGERLSDYTPTQTGNSNYSKRAVSLYNGGTEVSFDDGFYIKANGTITLTFDIAGQGFRCFSAWSGIDKSIRDNQPWGEYANATIRVYADDALLFERAGMGWKTDMRYICVKIPQGAQTLKLEVTDTSGQGATGWGDCTLYR